MAVRFDGLVVRLWNRFCDRRERRASVDDLRLGYEVFDERATRVPVGIPNEKRTQHLVVLGKTGAGKSSLLRYMCAQDIRRDHGFLFFDLHGDTTIHLLRLFAMEERRRGLDLSKRIILVDPADPERSAGINILEAQSLNDAYVEVSEVVQILKERWQLQTFGARTEELLRNSLLVLFANALTVLEIAPLLTRIEFRRRCIENTPHGEARTYFEQRYEVLSEPMKGVYREAILNKVSAYSGDAHFRHLLGQRRSSFDFRRAVNDGKWIIVNLEKGRLGEQATTLGALLVTRLKHALLGRTSRRLFTLYCDELQNLVSFEVGVEALLSEARKFGVSVVSANQYLDQYPPATRAALLATGTQVFFQMSGPDAERIAHWLGEGRYAANRLRNLPARHGILYSGTNIRRQFRVPTIKHLIADPRPLLQRIRTRWTQDRRAIDAEIAARYSELESAGKGVLDGWE